MPAAAERVVMRETTPDVVDSQYIFRRRFQERCVCGTVRSREGRGRELRAMYDREVARYWAGLRLLARLSETGSAVLSGEIVTLLGTRSVKGIGSGMSGTRGTLFTARVWMGEAALRGS